MLTKVLFVHSVDSELIHRYTVLAGSYCLLRYIENVHNFTFCEHTLKIEHANCYSNMLIDNQTALDLELIRNRRTGNQKESLFGVLNYTKTIGGERLLRANILRPNLDLVTINTRLDFVEMMLQQEQYLLEISEILSEFPDLERLLSGLSTSSPSISLKSAKVGIDTLIYLKSSLDLLSTRLAPTLQLLQKSIRSKDASAKVTGKRMHNEMKGSQAEPDALNDSLLEIFLKNFGAEGFTTLYKRLENVLTESTRYSSSPEVMRHQECFALRELAAYQHDLNTVDSDISSSERGCNENLSRLQIQLAVARTSFLQCVEDIHVQADLYSDLIAKWPDDSNNSHDDSIAEICSSAKKAKTANIKVKYSSQRGYHLVIPLSEFPMDRLNGNVSLPDVFIQPIMQSKSIICTTAQVSSLSDRAQEAISTALQLTHTLIRTTIDEIRTQSLKDLHAFVDSISLMDMLLSFSNLVHFSSNTFCRPILTTSHLLSSNSSHGGSHGDNVDNDNDTIMLLERSRHPIICEQSSRGAKQSFVENSLLIDPTNSQVHIVTGVNGCGKSTFIKQVAMITVMAQIGCFLPCVSATIPLRDKLFTRLSSQDDMENNLSTFQLEMKETAYILEHVTDRSLVIIDELGRGSSLVDGLSIAFAVAEYLATHTKAFTLFATHFPQITQLSQLYPNVRNIHMKTELVRCAAGTEQVNVSLANSSGSHNRYNRLLHHYNLHLGFNKIQQGYGIMCSEDISLDSNLIQDALRYQSTLSDLYPMLLGDKNIVSRNLAPRDCEKNLQVESWCREILDRLVQRCNEVDICPPSQKNSECISPSSLLAYRKIFHEIQDEFFPQDQISHSMSSECHEDN